MDQKIDDDKLTKTASLRMDLDDDAKNVCTGDKVKAVGIIKWGIELELKNAYIVE